MLITQNITSSCCFSELSPLIQARDLVSPTLRELSLLGGSEQGDSELAGLGSNPALPLMTRGRLSKPFDLVVPHFYTFKMG